MKTISFISPSRNNITYLKWMYNSIRKNLGYRHEILLADDFSSDGTWEWLQEIKGKDQNIKMDPFNSSISIETCKKHNTDNLNNAKLLEEWKSTYKILIPKKKFKKKINKISKKKKSSLHSLENNRQTFGFF